MILPPHSMAGSRQATEITVTRGCGIGGIRRIFGVKNRRGQDMTLAPYRRKRDFSKTPEPSGGSARKAGQRFVIQKHEARRLHYDLRLEVDGVFKSWAVTRGPSLVAGEKRLAVHVEDHPLNYGSFEGTIPEGQYGAGTVIVWDRGKWSPTIDARKGLAKGHLEFVLKGKKLRGRWHLVRMAAKPNAKRENWLLIKAADSEARSRKDRDILVERPESIKSGLLIKNVKAAQNRSAARGRQRPVKTKIARKKRNEKLRAPNDTATARKKRAAPSRQRTRR
jgi:bifunctional non-homologous end joining protein LigD